MKPKIIWKRFPFIVIKIPATKGIGLEFKKHANYVVAKYQKDTTPKIYYSGRHKGVALQTARKLSD